MKKENVEKMLFDSASIYLVDTFDVSNLEAEITAKLIDTNLLCLSADGMTFTNETEIHDIQVAGFNGKRVKGFTRTLRNNGSIEGTALIVNKAILEGSLCEKVTNSSTKYDVYRPIEGIVADSIYKDVVLVGSGVKGQDALIVLHNAFNEDGFSLEFSEEDEAKCSVKFVSSYDSANLNESPVEIITLKEVDPTGK